jgi:restriction endonuclease SmaI-like protein
MANDPRSRERRIQSLADALRELSDSQIAWTEGVINQFRQKPDLQSNPDSDLINACVLEMFGDALQIHHCFSTEALSKDKFEYAFERVLNLCKIPAVLAPKGKPGHDITINGVAFSLKTQADKSLRRDFLHISKFMELGKGAWVTEKDLIGLRDQFFQHMRSYERILQLRRLTNLETFQEYELVEIPKELLLQAKKAAPVLMKESTQTPKPGTCKVLDAGGQLLFDLYFDAGGERKLQIRRLDKRQCIVHATWGIKRIPLTTDPTLE